MDCMCDFLEDVELEFDIEEGTGPGSGGSFASSVEAVESCFLMELKSDGWKDTLDLVERLVCM